jgi:hypothetical protein
MLKIKNRRRGPDFIVKIVTLFSIFTWLIIIVVIALYSMAKPANLQSSYFYRHAASGAVGAAAIGMKVLLFLNIVLAVWGIVANMSRSRRKTDRFRYSLLISLIISVIGLVVFMIVL